MNHGTLIGNLGSDPRVGQLPSGQAATDFTMAVNRRYVTNGQTVEETVWFKVKTYRNLAANCGRYLAKGRQVAVKGRVGQPEPYIGSDGKPYAINVLFAESVEFLGTPNGAAANQELDGAMAAAAGAAVVTEAEMMSASVDF